jgi:Dolichyl-phosphate-mannose-protein mannosyltransferase
MNNARTEQTQRRSQGLLLGGLIVVALVLRFARLGEWSLDSDEVFMRRDSINFKFTNPRPLLYFLDHYVIAPILPLDEFGIRLLPAAFGVLAIPVLYLVTRRLLGSRAALFATLLLVVSPVHVIYSQFGRYWSLVFLLASVYPYALYIGVRERNRRSLALAIVTGLLATLAHPSAVLLMGGPAVLLAVHYLRRDRLKMLWASPAFRWGLLVALVVAGAILIRFIPILQHWIYEHDANPGPGQSLLRKPPRLLKPVLYVLAYVEAWTIPLILAGAAGIYLLWRDRDRALAQYLVSLFLVPLAFLCLIMFRTPVSTYYLLSTAPVFFLGAGLFLDRVWQMEWTVRPRWLVPVLILVLMLIPGTPTLVSQLLNGRRFDFKAVAKWLEPRLTPGDIIYSDQQQALNYYLPELSIERLRYTTEPLTEAVRTVEGLGRGGALWIVAPAPAHAFRTNLRQGGLAQWIYDNCQLKNTLGRGRVDFRQQYLQVYRCPPLSGRRTAPG